MRAHIIRPFVAMLFGLTMVVPSAEAQLTLKPSRVTLRLKPGAEHTGAFQVTNQGAEPLEISVQAEDWSHGIQGQRRAVSWLQVEPDHLSLPPGDIREVGYRVRVPEQPDLSGELAAQVFFTIEQQAPGTLLRSRQGAIVYVAMQGTERVGVEITSVEAAYSSATPQATKPDRLDVVVAIANRSNVHIVPQGDVWVQGMDGHTLYTGRLISGWGLLPNEHDTYRAVLTGVYLQPGRYRLLTHVSCGSEVEQPIETTHLTDVIVDAQGALRLLP